MSDIRNNRRPKNNRRVNGVQRKNTMEAVNSASSVVRTSGTDAANTGEVTLVKMRIIRCSSRTWAMTERALDTFRA